MTTRTIPSPAKQRNKLLAALIVSCFCVNGFIPRSSITVNDYAAVSQALVGQSTFFQVVSFSALPLKIVNDLFAEKSTASQGRTAHRGKDTSRNTANTSADYPLLSRADTVNMSRFTSDLRVRDTLVKAVCGIRQTSVRSAALVDGPTPGERYAFLLFVLFFFLLPRSNVADGPAYNLFAQTPSAQRAQSRWVFYLGGTL